MSNNLLLIYRRRPSIFSFFIRLGSYWGAWSHVGVLTDDGNVIHAIPFKGVVKENLIHFLSSSSRHKVVEIPCPNKEEALIFLHNQIGKKYDWGAIFGFIFRSGSWEDNRKWICSELAEATIVAGGRRRFRKEAAKITVDQSFMVL